MTQIESPPVVPLTGADPIRVALVDDTPDIRDLLRLAFERTKRFEVVAEAADGREGVEAVRAHCPDVVILDISMPVMDGLEALPLIRDLCPRAAVVILSAFGSPDVRQKAMTLGAHAFILKGSGIRALVADVEALADRARSRTP